MAKAAASLPHSKFASGGFGFAGGRGRGAMDGFANALIGAATADVAAHEIVDIGIAGIGLFFEQGHRGHDLSGLAIAALRNVFGDPSLLDAMQAVGGQALDGGDFLSGDGGDGGLAGARGFAIDVHGAGAAQAGAAAKFRAGLVERVAQHPEQRHIRADVHGFGFSVEDESDGHGNPPNAEGYPTTTGGGLKTSKVPY